jgi:ATP-dependent RNA helicase RhlB
MRRMNNESEQQSTEPTAQDGPKEAKPTKKQVQPTNDQTASSEGRSRKRSRRRRRKPKSTWSLEQFQVPEKPGETRFHDLDLPEPIMHAIADLGFKYCTPIQAKTLLHVHAGHNVSGRAQTGTGKTAAFLITIFSKFLREPMGGERPMGTPRALVLAPTRELAIQIVKDAEDLGKYCRFNCLAVYGGLEVKKQKNRLDKRPVDLIVATPGRLLDFVRRKLINLKKVEILVIDEADRMLDMGFIPDVKRIIRDTPPKAKRRTMLFSATLTEDVLRLAAQWMPDPVICEVEPEQVAVETVNQIVYIVTSRDKFRLLYNLLQKRQDNRTLIFGNRRDHTQALASKLKKHGIPCELLSGAVPQKKRLRILEAFRTGDVKVVVATDVAGRGLHVKDIGLVVNYEFPYEAEDYVHRIGRTGRAGEAGTAISFACEDESFIIPDIEKYIGNPLKCTMPDEELMARVPRPPKK